MRSFTIGLLILLAGGCATSSSMVTDVPAAPTASAEEPAPSPVSVAQSRTPPANCPHVSLGGFNDVWRNEQVWPRLGCAVAPAEIVAGTEAYLDCAHSIWLRDQRLFVILPYTSRPGWSFVPDESGMPLDAPLMIAPFPIETIGFEATGRHGWWTSAAVSVDGCEGLSKTSETPFEGQMQQFEGGGLLWNGDVAFVLFADGSWIMF